jgi:hypothetical protein
VVQAAGGGSICVPRRHEDEVVFIDTQQLEWLLNGYDIWKMKPHEKVHYSRIS